MRGCTTFDCYGAGQKVSNVTFKGRSWKESTTVKTQMVLVFSIVRPLHELLWYLADAIAVASAPLRVELQAQFDRIDELSQGNAHSLFKINDQAQRDEVLPLLVQVSDEVRAAYPNAHSFVGKDLTGKTFDGVIVRGADFSGSILVNTDLSGADFAGADMLQANLDHATVNGADFSGAMFLTQKQLNATDGDARTIIGPRLYRPSHWPEST